MNKKYTKSPITHHLLALFVIFVVVAAWHMPALAAVTDEARGGYITSISFAVASQTEYWQGYYGAISYLDPKSPWYPLYFNTSAPEASSIRQIVLNISTFTPNEYILVTSSSYMNIVSLQAGNVSKVDAITGTGSDSGTNTFTDKSTFDKIPGRGVILNVPTVHLSGNFSEGLLNDSGNNNAFIVPIVNDTTGYEGILCNFQFILPTNRTNPVSYYMYYLSSQVTNQSVVGQITHSNNNTGITNVAVNLTAVTTMNLVGLATTNETGYYEFTNVNTGDYYVNATKIRYWDNSTAVSVTVNETQIATLQLWLVGDVDNNGKTAQPNDLTLMLRVVLWEHTGNWRYDLNRNGINGDVGDLVLMNRAALGEIILT
ncbi:MAG: hypothetical protein BA869_12835 [Desulfuromonadales bacterium C00003107]|nr:MAG: hypothetical protein BA869_12835 [Desulfuromonadales bacterium C00003107]